MPCWTQAWVYLKTLFVKVLDSDIVKTIPISELRVGDLVESFNIENGEVQYRKVEKVHELEVKRENQIKISFKSRWIYYHFKVLPYG